MFHGSWIYSLFYSLYEQSSLQYSFILQGIPQHSTMHPQFFSWKTLLLDSLVTQLETIRPNLMFKDRYIYINLQPTYITAKYYVQTS